MNSSSRPAISALLRRRVLIESGHRCAIPTCRYIEVELHHIIPWETTQSHEYENLIALCPNCHSRADRKEIDRKSLLIYKASLRFTHDKFSQFEVDILFEAAKLASDQALIYPPAMDLLVIRLLEAEFITIVAPSGGGVSSMGMSITPRHLQITQKGRAYVASLGGVGEWGEDEG
jgi:hypothetical protein